MLYVKTVMISCILNLALIKYGQSQTVIPLIYFNNPDSTSNYKSLTLLQVLSIATHASIESKLARESEAISKLEFKAYMLDGKPQIKFYGDLPGYNKSNLEVRQPDGSIRYLPRIQTFSSTNLSIVQPLRFSGGNISFNSDFTRYSDISLKDLRFRSTPFFVQLTQPLLNYNPYYHDKIIQTLRFKEGQKQLESDLIEIKSQAARLFFDLLEKQINRSIAQTNYVNSTVNYENEIKKQKLGASKEENVLQLKLQLITAKNELEYSEIEQRKAEIVLKNLLSTEDTTKYVLELPNTVPDIGLSEDLFINEAKKNRPEFLDFERSSVELEQEQAIAKSTTHQININAIYGVNSSGEQFKSLYERLNPQQGFSIGFSMTIADWGRSANKRMSAKEQLNINLLQRQKLEADLHVQIVNQLSQSILLRRNIFSAYEAANVARELYTLKDKLFQLGQINVTELQLAAISKDNSERAYFSSVRKYWESVFDLQRICACDPTTTY